MAASLVALIQLTGTVVGYLSAVGSASKDQVELSKEVSGTLPILISLRFRVESASNDDPWFTAVRELGVKNGPFDQFSEALNRLSSMLTPAKGLAKVSQKLSWPFKKSEVGEILLRIERMKTAVNLAMSNDLM